MDGWRLNQINQLDYFFLGLFFALILLLLIYCLFEITITQKIKQILQESYIYDKYLCEYIERKQIQQNKQKSLSTKKIVFLSKLDFINLYKIFYWVLRKPMTANLYADYMNYEISPWRDSFDSFICHSDCEDNFTNKLYSSLLQTTVKLPLSTPIPSKKLIPSATKQAKRPYSANVFRPNESTKSSSILRNPQKKIPNKITLGNTASKQLRKSYQQNSLHQHILNLEFSHSIQKTTKIPVHLARMFKKYHLFELQNNQNQQPPPRKPQCCNISVTTVTPLNSHNKGIKSADYFKTLNEKRVAKNPRLHQNHKA